MRRFINWLLIEDGPVDVYQVRQLLLAWIRNHYMDAPLLSATFQLVVGGVMTFIAGILFGSALPAGLDELNEKSLLH